MERQYYPKNAKKGPCVVALGVFDGVHLGHRALLAAAKEEAKRRGCLFTVFTFSEDGGPKDECARIYPEEEKLSLLEALGADRVILCDFSAVRDLSPRDFCRDVLTEALGAVSVVCGYNFRFGKGASGDAETLAEEMSLLGCSALVIPPVKHGEQVISSSTIRRLLAEGRIEEANKMLGAPYRIRADVSHGEAIGRTRGVPTANAKLPAGAKLKNGVYRTAVKTSSGIFSAATNLGVCPTIRERKEHLETHISGFSGDLYGEDHTLYFLGYLREEKHFSSENELYLQINVDISEANSQNAADPCFKHLQE